MTAPSPDQLPIFDDQGVNIADPHDRRGQKTAYITLLQAIALERYVGIGNGMALDLGCGYGRMSATVKRLGWDVVGMDPSLRVLRSAAVRFPDISWCAARLPDLPIANGAFDLVLAQNLLRVLHINGVLDAAHGIPNYLRRGGRLVVVDNVRPGHGAYIEDEAIVDMFESQGLHLVAKWPIRRARWFMIYLIRYGLVPTRLHRWLAEIELRRLAATRRFPRWQYTNVLYVFEKRA